MKRLTYRVKLGGAQDVVLVDKKSVKKCLKWQDTLKRLAEYEDLEEQGNLLKNPLELKNEIIDRMKESLDEYRSYSGNATDHMGGKADSMEVAIRLVKIAFSEAMNK